LLAIAIAPTAANRRMLDLLIRPAYHRDNCADSGGYDSGLKHRDGKTT